MSILERLLGRRVVAVWEGVTFRAGDRVVSRHSDETTLKPEAPSSGRPAKTNYGFT